MLEKKGNYINFRRIGFEFRRIDKNNSPIITAALIINQSVNNASTKLDEIIKSRDYQNLLKISVVFYRRFSNSPIVDFNNLISLINWSTGNHLGEYVFLQIILGDPDFSFSGEQIRYVCKKFPTLFEPIFISRIYKNPKSLFINNLPDFNSNQTVTADYLIKCGADDYFIEQFLNLTFNPSFNFFRQICDSKCYQILLGLLALRPDFFLIIQNLCRSDLFEVISQIMNSNIQTFLDIFFSNYQIIPSSIIKCVNNNLSSMNLNQYAKNLDKQHFQNLFDFIFQNEYISMIQDGITFNDNFVPCLYDLYLKNPDLVFRIFKQTDNQVLNGTIGSIIISSDNFYTLPFPLIDAVLSKPDFAFEIQSEKPQFFFFVLSRYPSCAMAIAEIINKNQRKRTSMLEPDSNQHLKKKMDKAFYKRKRTNNHLFSGFDEDDDFKKSQNADSWYTERDEVVPIENFDQLLKLIYEIDEEAFCKCLSPNSTLILNLLQNFIPTSIVQNQQNDTTADFPVAPSIPPNLTQNNNLENNCKTTSNENYNDDRYHSPNSFNNNNNNENSRYIRPNDIKNKENSRYYRQNNDNDNSIKNRRYHRPGAAKNNNNEVIPPINKDKSNIMHLTSSNNEKDDKPIRAEKRFRIEPPLKNDPTNKTISQTLIIKGKNNDNDNNNNKYPQNLNISDIPTETNRTPEFIINPDHLHFPSLDFFIELDRYSILTQENLSPFFINYINFIVDDSKWMKIIPQIPLLFYQFTNVLFKREDLRKYNLPITISFITNMYSTLRSNRDSFTTLTEFLLNNQFYIQINDFPLFLKIKLLSLITNCIDNFIGQFTNLFILLIRDYRCLCALDETSKSIFLRICIINNLDDHNCHKAFIMAYINHHDLINPFNYIKSIMKNKDAIAMTLSNDENYFDKWYNLIIKNPNSPVMQAINNSIRGGEDSFDHNSVFELFRTVMVNALNYPKFQNDLEFLSLLCQFLDPGSSIYNINANNNENPNVDLPVHALPLNISCDSLKVVLKKKMEPHSEVVDKYNFIFSLFITYYSNEIFKAIPLPPSISSQFQAAVPR